MPNADHSLDGSNALDTLVAFHYCIVHDVPRPELQWSFGADGRSIRVQCKTQPKRVLLWQAHNAANRDFRVDSIGKAYESRDIQTVGAGVFEVNLESPANGWNASFLQCEFDVGAPTPMRLSTGVRILPDELPHEKRPIPLIEE